LVLEAAEGAQLASENHHEAITGGDWSIGFNSLAPTSMAQAKLFESLGKGLRAVYMDLVREPLPDHLAVYLDKLRDRDAR
jgi:hypothetical protein